MFVVVPAALTAIGGGYLYQIATTALIFIILAASLNLVTGTAGLLSLGHAGFYGIGAYAAAILSTRLGLALPPHAALGRRLSPAPSARWWRCRPCAWSASTSPSPRSASAR